MSNPFLKGFDELFNDILTRWRDQTFHDADGNVVSVDISQGSLIYLKSACLASMDFGIRRYQQWICDQIFPDTADTEALEHHAWVRGLSRKTDETDAELLARLLAYIREPPAGGKKADYVSWALEIDNVSAAYCVPLGQGLGTVDVVIVAHEDNTGSEVPSSHTALTGSITSVETGKLVDTGATFATAGVVKGDQVTNSAGAETTVSVVDGETALSLADDIFTATPDTYTVTSLCGQVKAYIDTVRPVTASALRVLPPTIVTQDVTMVLTGDNADPIQAAADVTAYLDGFVPGQALYLAQLIALGIQNGADNVTVTTPSADVSVTDYQMIRAGTINVT